ncbi:related to Phosphatidylinositol N-acetylglucosaminyltransferase subunit GPI1 [Nakaseomyces glabratus]|nr:N-acetylglucosaminyl transferase component (Gpi1) [Nakaseomyces glabratus]QNG12402.1 uncharacterized protein GWK60_B02079 [Nakaseomyces glabratus]SCV17476.1 related to Phosphatidylinositol N-acetylglucosaminyltransferase subunit GPI1 [Nakaseomyces glabratus]SLM17262.1 related to Phosphatidylinositol N-acetylglucosaminyltransferase subunit GPI1 [Nakaseomyces glabratus]
MSYVFWPESLRIREQQLGDGPLVAVALQVKDSYVVLDICYEQVIRTIKLEKPYCVVAKSSGTERKWVYSIDGTILVWFKEPKVKLMQFYSLEPLSLELPEKIASPELDPSADKANAIKLFSHPRYQNYNRDIRDIILVINVYFRQLKKLHKEYPKLSREVVSSSAQLFEDVKHFICKTWIWAFFRSSFHYLLLMVNYISSSVLVLLNRNFPQLINISATAQQIDLRCRQHCYFPVQYLKITKNIQFREQIPRFRSSSIRSILQLRDDLPFENYPEYIRMYNTIWLIFNDLSFGLIISAYITENSEAIVTSFSSLTRWLLYDQLRDLTIFLSNNPFGIKLNQEMGGFLSELFLWVIDVSYFTYIRYFIKEEIFRRLLKVLVQVSYVIGATFTLAIIIDFISIISFPILIFYHISCKLYRLQVNIMVSLFYLFCGKKRNVLRKRVDYKYFDLDQLLMGTLLFIILLFLFPTVLVFYAAYTSLRVVFLIIELGLQSLIALINHFPLFALLLRLKDPMRIPGGVYFTTSFNQDRIVMRMYNKPTQIGLMFRPYQALMRSLYKNYLSPAAVKHLIKGGIIVMQRKNLYSVLYSSLPDNPVSSGELYDGLFNK